MSWIAEAWRRLRSLARRADVERGLDAELRFHVEQLTAKNLRAGMAPDEARRAALARFGAIERAREQTRDEFGALWLEDVARDLRYALRSLRRAPGFTIVAILTLAIGIGATTAVFTVVHGVLIKPLPYPDADELVDLRHVAPGLDLPFDLPNSATQLFSYQEHSRAFQHIGFWSTTTVTVAHDTDPELVSSLLVTAGTLPALGVPPAAGRWFSAEDDEPGSPESLLLTHGYWQRRFAGDPSIVGRSIIVDSRPRQVIGIMPRAFRFLETDAELILPFRFDRSRLALGEFNFQGLARLAPAVTLADANADVARVIPIWLQAWPPQPGVDATMLERAGFAPALRPLERQVVGDFGNVLWVLMGTIGIVLLIACANVANLLLVRAEGRQQELAIRSALGAGRRRIARALLVESVTLGLAGGACGVALALAGVRLLVATGPANLPRLGDITMDPVVLTFAMAISLLSGFAFGLMPAVRRGGPKLAAALRGSGRGASHGRERRRARHTLAVAQVTLATVLLVASGLMVRSFVALTRVQPGFEDAARVQIVRITIPEVQVPDPERVLRMQIDMRDRFAALPGVAAASFANSAPMQGNNSHHILLVEHQPTPDGQLPAVRRFKFIAPGFFETLRTPLIAGRDVDWSDIHGNRPVVIVSENLARELWADPAAALGKRIRDADTSPWREVIGVVANVHDDGVDEPAPALVYWPVLMESFRSNPVQVTRAVTFVVRSERAGAESLIAEMRDAVRAVTGGLPFAQVSTLGELLSRSLVRTSFALVMLAIAATMALLLAVIGLYGVLSYAVSQRIREIGIRSALGASNAALRAMFVRDGLVLAAVGIALGLVAAGALTRVMTSLLFGVSALDPITFVAVAVVLAAAALLASYLPAHRATAVDPAEVLRSS